MHREDSLDRQPVVHHGEDSLFHLTAVPGAADNGHILLDIEDDENLGIEAVLFPVLVGQTGRITSYNVCYTKLLRFIIFATGQGQFDQFRQRSQFRPEGS